MPKSQVTVRLDTAQLARAQRVLGAKTVMVLHELRRGARTNLELQFVNELTRKLRIITPAERHWPESAEILSIIRGKKGYGQNKLRELAFDALIALSVREIGATLITCNRKDFEGIRSHKHFKVLYW